MKATTWGGQPSPTYQKGRKRITVRSGPKGR